MGTIDRGIYLPTQGETGWADEVNLDLNRLADVGYNVKSYGAVGDGTTDDTAAIVACIAAAESSFDTALGGRTTVYIPPGNYKVALDQIVFRTHVWAAGGARFSVSQTGSGTAITCGTTTNLYYLDLRLPAVWYTGTGAGTTSWQAGSIGIKLLNLYSPTVHIPAVRFFETGVKDMSVANTRYGGNVYLNYINSNKVQLDCVSAVSVNYWGGTFNHLQSATPGAITGCHQVRITSCDSCQFFGAWYETRIAQDGADLYIDNSGYCAFPYMARMENNLGAGVTYANGAYGNVIYGPWTAFLAETTVGTAPVVPNRLDGDYTGTFRGFGSPEGVVNSGPGGLYVSRAGDGMWVKAPMANVEVYPNNTNWRQVRMGIDPGGVLTATSAASDTFARISSTSLGVSSGGATWAPQAGTWGTRADGAYHVTDSGVGLYDSALLETNAFDMDVTISVKLVGGGTTTPWCGVLFRAVNATDYWAVMFNHSVTQLDLYRASGGGLALKAVAAMGGTDEVPVRGLDDGAFHTLRVIADRDDIKVSWDNEVRMHYTMTDADYRIFGAYTKVGLWQHWGNAPDFTWDNLTVTKLPKIAADPITDAQFSVIPQVGDVVPSVTGSTHYLNLKTAVSAGWKKVQVT